MGGIGCCGRPLCCATFLGDFEPVSIRMAKEQNLSLNPTKISGICGRLMCCLKYESNCYCGGHCPKKAVVQEPQQGSIVATIEGDGKVISTNGQRRTATILLLNGRTIVAAWEDVVEKDPEEAAAAAAAQPAHGEKEDGQPTEKRGPRRPRHSREHTGAQEHARGEGESGERKSGRRRRSRRPHEMRDGQGRSAKSRENQPRGERGESEHRSRRRRPRDRQPHAAQDGEEKKE